MDRGLALRSGARHMSFPDAAYLTIAAFMMNFAWEKFQCPLFIHADPSDGFGAMVRAAIGDVALTWIAYGLLAARFRRWAWGVGKLRGRDWALWVGVAVTLSVAVEIAAIASHRWSYASSNPTIPGTGVSVVPVLQAAILGPASLAVMRLAAQRFPIRRSRGSD